MDFAKAFSFPFQDPDWVKKVGTAALVFLIPVIGQMIVLGWGLEITRRVITDHPEPLPDWSDFSGYLSRGFQVSVVSLAYALPAILLFICGQLGSIGLTFVTGNSNSNLIMSLVTGVSILLSCLMIIIFLAISFVIPVAEGVLAETGDMKSAFHFTEIFGLLKAAPGAYLFVILGSALAGMVLAPIGMIVCFVGMFISAAFIITIRSHLTGQAYKIAKAAQSGTVGY